MVHGEDGVVLGTPVCRALGAIDEQWPSSALQERAQFSSSTVKTAHADTVHAPAECSLPDCSVSEVHTQEHPLSEDELLSNLNWIHRSATKVYSQVHVVPNDDETSVSSLLQEYKDVPSIPDNNIYMKASFKNECYLVSMVRIKAFHG